MNLDLQTLALAALGDGAGAMWVATDTGLARIDQATTPYRLAAWLDAAAGLPVDRLHGVHVDRRGRVWAATHGGLALLAGDAVRHTLTEADGLPAAVVGALGDDAQGRVWIGTKAGLAVLHAGGDGARRCCGHRSGPSGRAGPRWRRGRLWVAQGAQCSRSWILVWPAGP